MKQPLSNATKDSVSVVILTQGLRDELNECLHSIITQQPPFSEIIVVNNSNLEIGLASFRELRNNIIVLSTGGNFGTSARNIGAAMAEGRMIVLVDDDIVLSQNDTVRKVISLLSSYDAPSAICFKVTEVRSDEFQPLSWGHPRDRLTWQEKRFETDCITEGAFAIDASVFREVGGFWPGIFIGEEGMDLFFRLIRTGARIEYVPEIQCAHLHALDGRQPLRGFYHYARSDILIAWRHLPFFTAIAFLLRSYAMLMLQTFRSFNLLVPMYVLLGSIDGICWILGGSIARIPISADIKQYWSKLRSGTPSVFRRFWRQLTQRNL